jgi:hypothetical protein
MMNVRFAFCYFVSIRYADISCTPYLEGLVVLKKNPDFKDTSAAGTQAAK